jgi:membrane protease YdiL (CAAX protease family)
MAGRTIGLPDQTQDGSAHVPVAKVTDIGDFEAAEETNFVLIRLVAFLSLIGLTIAEVVTVFVDPGLGALGHGALAGTELALAGLVAYRATAEGQTLGASRRRLEASFLVALALPSLLRLVTLAMPRDELSGPATYGADTLCLLAATWAAVRANGYSWRDAGMSIQVTWNRLRFHLLAASTGVVIGYLEYLVWRPEGFINEFALSRMVIATLVVVFVAGIAEELMLRGVIQVVSSALFGSVIGITFVAALFAIMHIGYRSLLGVDLAFAVAVWLGLTVRVTGSLAGASLAHGIANICFFVAFPLLLK